MPRSRHPQAPSFYPAARKRMPRSRRRGCSNSSIAAYRVLLCCELVGAIRLLRQRGLDDQFSGVVGESLALAAVLPHNDEDRDLRGDIALAESVLDDIGRLVAPDPRP